MTSYNSETLGDWWVIAPDDGSFHHCNKCGKLPKIWQFNNGRFAICECLDSYDEIVRAESIMSLYKRTGMTQQVDTISLEVKWNHFADTGENVPIDEGMW